MKIVTKKESFTNPLYLESGRILEPYKLVYETYGEMNEARDNAVLITHALSGSHHAAGRYEGDRKAGWWDGLIGDGKAIDTKRFFVICVNVIGSCYGSTGPMSRMYPSQERYRLKFPVITVKDMVKAQRILLDRLGIDRLHAIVGGSMGGMQALRFAIEYPNFAKHTIAMAATHATRPWAIAFNKVVQEAIVKDPKFKNGNYDPDDFKEEGFTGLAVGRMAGHISYLSPESMDRKFGRSYVETDGLFELFGKFQVERYLEYNGYGFSKWFDPLSYLYITKAINIFDVSRGYDTLDEALGRIRSDLHLISFKRDMLFMPEEMKEIEIVMKAQGQGGLVSYYEVDSDYGHDAFLVELDKFSDYVAHVIDR
ncbi:homoserine O-acetyltransferase MetX [Hydrogenimonas sp.]